MSLASLKHSSFNRYFLFYLPVFFIACSAENSHDFNLKFSKSLSFPLDTLSSRSAFEFLEMEDKAVFVWVNSESSSIKINSVFDKSIDSTIYLKHFEKRSYSCWAAPKTGIFITGLGLLDGSDNLLMKEHGNNKLIEVRHDSAVAFDVGAKDKELSTTYSKINHDGDYLLINVRGGKEFYSHSVLLVKNFGSRDQTSELLHPFPNLDFTRNPYLTIPSSVIVHDKVYTSFAYEDSIHVYDITNGINHKVEAKTDSALNIKKLKENEHINDRVQFVNDDEYYTFLIYDEFRDLFYRIAVLRGEKVLDDLPSTWSHKPWKLLVFNSKFQKLKEIDFTGFDYWYREVYPTREGLIIGKNFMEDFIHKFDSLKFDLYEINVN